MKKKVCPLSPAEARRIAARLSAGKEDEEILFRQLYLHLTEGNLDVAVEIRAAFLNWEIAKIKSKGG